MDNITPSEAIETADAIRVLLIDDQRIVGETVRRMLAVIDGLEYRFCSDPTGALEEANSFAPTVILQDLIMPGADGIDMVRSFRANASTAATPLIVLSSKEEPLVKAEAFAAGANDYLVKLPDRLELVARVRYHSAAYTLRRQRDEAFRVLEEQQRVIAQEIADAAAYVRSLLPSPMLATSPVPSDWRFLTSSSLGGDSFGYHWIDDTHLAIYLLDVCGHGVGPALLSVSAVNTVRNSTLKNTDFLRPSEVLAALNQAFPMSERDGKYFTIWYGIFDTATRTMTFASGGHPPAVVVASDGTTIQLSTGGLIVGAVPDAQFREAQATIPPNAKLYVMSDGCYELTRSGDDALMNVNQFIEVLAQAAPHADALDRIVAASRAWQGRADFDDDFSLIEFCV
jgi:sigma-B regulation protein RsbU (phosphoserine phosphatase)